MWMVRFVTFVHKYLSANSRREGGIVYVQILGLLMEIELNTYFHRPLSQQGSSGSQSQLA